MMNPLPNLVPNNSGLNFQYLQGMDLRDWFAGIALPECIGWGEPKEVCARAYRYADEMMKAREIK